MGAIRIVDDYPQTAESVFSTKMPPVAGENTGQRHVAIRPL